MERCTGKGGRNLKVGGIGMPILDSSMTIQQWLSLTTQEVPIIYSQVADPKGHE